MNVYVTHYSNLIAHYHANEDTLKGLFKKNSGKSFLAEMQQCNNYSDKRKTEIAALYLNYLIFFGTQVIFVSSGWNSEG